MGSRVVDRAFADGRAAPPAVRIFSTTDTEPIARFGEMLQTSHPTENFLRKQPPISVDGQGLVDDVTPVGLQFARATNPRRTSNLLGRVMSVEIETKPWIQIHLTDPALAGVTVHPEDGDSFSLPKQRIAKYGHLAYRIEAYDGQFAALKQELVTWSAVHSDVVRETFLVMKGDHYLFLVVLKGKAHDAVLEDALTDLDMKIAQDPEFDLINLSVLALPAFAEEAIRSFLPHRVGPKGEGGDAERGESPGAGES